MLRHPDLHGLWGSHSVLHVCAAGVLAIEQNLQPVVLDTLALPVVFQKARDRICAWEGLFPVQEESDISDGNINGKQCVQTILVK